MTFIATLLAKKIWGILIFCFACLSIVLLPVSIVQSIRLNGLGFLGWEISEGYKPMAQRLERENVKLVANNLVLSNGLDKCNIGVKSLEVARQTFVREAQNLVNERLRLQEEYRQRIARVNGIKATDAMCPTVDNIFTTGFGK